MNIADDTPAIYYVYELRDHEGRVFYVGKGKGNRINMHRTPSYKNRKTHLYNKIRKLESEGLVYVAKKVFESCSESDAFAEEKRLIAFYGRDNLCNHTDGGEGVSGHIPTKETLEKRSASIKRNWVVTREARIASLKGRKHTEEFKKSQSLRMKSCSPERLANFRAAAIKKGDKVSPETLLKIRAAHTNRSAETRQKLSVAAVRRVEKNTPHWQKFSAAGRNPTLETRKKMGRKGRIMSAETRQKMSESRKGKFLSAETRAKISLVHKGKEKVKKTYTTPNGQYLTVYEIAKTINASAHTVRCRIYMGWAIARILATPVHPRKSPNYKS